MPMGKDFSYIDCKISGREAFSPTDECTNEQAEAYMTLGRKNLLEASQ